MTPILIFHLLLLPWLSLEFRRRYDGRHPLLHATGLLLIPGVQWVLAFRLFACHRSLAGAALKQRNSGALLFGFSLLMMLAATILFLVLVSVAHWAAEPNVYGLMMLALHLLVIIPFLFLARFGFKRSRQQR